MSASLLGELDQQPTRHGASQRVIYLMMTKSDRLPGVQADNLTEERVVTESLKSHPVYARVQRQLARRTATAIWRVHLTSAVGWNFDGVSDPRQRRVEPANLFEPLRDAILEADEVQRTGHESLWKGLQTRWGGPPGLFTACSRRLRELDDFAATHHVHEGKISAEIARSRDELLQMSRIQFVTRTLVALVLLITVVSLAWYQGRRNQSVAYDEFARLIQERRDDASAPERAAFFADRIAPRQWEWLWGLADRQNQAAEQNQADLAIVARLEAEAAWAVLLKEDEPLREKEQHPRRHHRALAYREKYQQAAPQAIQTQLEALVKETGPAYDADRSARQQAGQIALQSLDDFPRKVQALREYAQRPDALEAAEAITEADKLITEEKQLRVEDEQAWTEAINLPSSTEAENTARAEAVRAYLQRQYALRKTEGDSLLSVILRRGMDMEEYNQIVQASQTTRTGDDIERVSSLIQNYLASDRHGRVMAPAVQRFAARVEEFKRPRNVDVYLQSVSLPKPFVTGTFWGNPIPFVEVTINGTSNRWRGGRTPLSGDAYTASPGVRLGTFPIQYGSNQSLTVFTKVTRELFAEEKATGYLSDSRWIGQHLNGPVFATSSGHRVPITLACYELIFPTLTESFPAR